MKLILRKILPTSWTKTEGDPEKLNTVGRLTLTMCGEKNESVIQAYLHLENQIQTKSLKQIFKERLIAHYPKFRSIMKRQRFYEQKAVDIDAHFKELILPNNGNDAQGLSYLLSPLINQPFNMDIPLWEAYIIRNYKAGGTILFVRVHHCIADGAALGKVLRSLCDNAPPMQKLPIQQEFEGWQKLGVLVLMGAIHIINFVRVILKSFVTILGTSDPLIPHVKTIPAHLSRRKKPVWTRNYDLEGLKRLGRPYQATLNDILLTVIAGALDRIRRHHSAAKNLRTYDVRCINPTNIRATAPDHDLDNQVSFLFPQLPLGCEAPIKRLQIVKRRMDAIKHMDEMGWMKFFVSITDMIPARYMRLACNWLTSKTTVAISNVRGPSTQLTLLGSKIVNTVAFLPAMHGIGYSFCIFSYNDQVRIGITVDSSLLNDANQIVHAIDEEISALSQATQFI